MSKKANFLSPDDMTVEQLEQVFALADKIVENPDAFKDVCHGKVLATLFYEPSTRTRLSFETAMHRLGGSVIGFSDPSSSSTVKGETIADTARMISCYADIVAMRHYIEGAPQAAALYCNAPVINAGDGGHQHPTQTLADLYTIRAKLGRLNNLTVGLCGDLKFGRTVHSLIQAMSRYENITFVCISPKELVLPDYIFAQMEQNPNVKVEVCEDLKEAIGKLDVLYMTRVQGERFDDPAEYERLKDVYILDADKMAAAKEKMIVLHPLPRVNEITTEVDDDPRAAYFAQAQYAMFARMALIMTLLGTLENKDTLGAKMHLWQMPSPKQDEALRCTNPKCLTNHQPTLPHVFVEKDGKKVCYYCDHEGEAK